jgi:hypothetical protein
MELEEPLLILPMKTFAFPPHSSLLQKLDALEHNSDTNEAPDTSEHPQISTLSSLLAFSPSISNDAPNEPAKT